MKNHLAFPRTRQTIAILAGSALLLLAAGAPPAHAQTNIWEGDAAPPANAVWDTIGNWSLNLFPAAGGGTSSADLLFLSPFPSSAGVTSNPILLNQNATFQLQAASMAFFDNYTLNPGTFFGGAGGLAALTLTTPTFPTPGGLNGTVFVAEGKTATFNIYLRDAGAFPPLGPSILKKTGPGTLILNGQNLYTGDTTVNGGTLLVNGSIQSASTFVNPGGTLGGTGTLFGSVFNSGTVNPGASPGTLHIWRNYTQSSGGKLAIEIASARNYDRLEVGGEAKLDGDLEVFLTSRYRPKRGQKFTILKAERGVSGEFDDVEAPVWDNLTFRAFYEDYRVYLKTVVASFEAAAETPNQRAVGQVLDEVIYDERAEKIVDDLYKRDLDELPGELDKIAPEELASIFTISTSLANVQSLNLQRRTDDLRAGSSGFSASGLAMQGSGPGYSGSLFGAAGPSGKESKEMKEPAPLEEKKWGAFLTGVGEWVDVGGDGNARGYDITTGGFTLGLDYKVCPNFAIGIAAGYAGTAADLTDDGRVWVNGGKLGIYATTFVGGWYADAAVTGGYNSYDTKRSALQGNARGDTEGGELNVLVGTGFDIRFGALTIGPTATFQYTLVGIDGFTETGSLAPLNIAGRNAESVRTALGFKASYDWKVGGVLVRPEIRASWQHEYGDSSYGLDASFANGAGNSFLVNGPEIGRDSLLIGAGVAIQCSERFSTYLYYDGELGRSNYDRHGVSGGVRVAF